VNVVVFQSVFYLECIKIIFLYFLKLFLILANQNDLKDTKQINF
jgi:hypothetical protein